MKTYTAVQLTEILASHRKWRSGDPAGTRAYLAGADLAGANLARANLARAYLAGAYLAGAYLAGADLTRAYLAGADLAGAYLAGANLASANLARADLTDADLTRAYLAGADLAGANLAGAKFSDETVINTGETWREYTTIVVPQLLLAGERGADAIVKWGKHTWDDCPIAIAFNVHSEEEAPALLRPRVRQFIQFYDAGLIPAPEPVGEQVAP